MNPIFTGPLSWAPVGLILVRIVAAATAAPVACITLRRGSRRPRRERPPPEPEPPVSAGATVDVVFTSSPMTTPLHDCVCRSLDEPSGMREVRLAPSGRTCPLAGIALQDFSLFGVGLDPVPLEHERADRLERDPPTHRFGAQQAQRILLADAESLH